MDTKLVGEWGTEILSYRLRTARQKKRAQYDDFHKRLIAIDKKQADLFHQKHCLGFEILDPPVQKGWERVFVLRQDVARSKHADFFAGILAKINTKQLSNRKDFLKKKRKFGRKKYVPREQFLLKPGVHQFKKFDFSQSEQQQFHEEWCYDNHQKRFFKVYVFNEPWRFVLRVQPNMIDKIRRIDPEIECELAAISNWLDKKHYRPIISKLRGTNYRWWRFGEHVKNQEINYLVNRPINRILDELKNEIV